MNLTNTTAQQRCVVEKITPEIDGGRYAVKAIVGDIIPVEADVLADGHDILAAHLLYKHESEKQWQIATMQDLGNDRWGATFKVNQQGTYVYTVEAWVDHIATWQHEVEAKVKDGQHLVVEMLVGRDLLKAMAKRASKEDKAAITDAAKIMTDASRYNEAIALAVGRQMHDWIVAYPDKANSFVHSERKLYVDREKARFSAWYSMFPRSAARVEGQHGTFADVEKLLPRIAELGFDVLYLPPIHPIGTAHRKGKNNSVICLEGEPGVPYGIGSVDGGHTAILSELGTLADFKQLIAACNKLGIEMAMDLAIQCSPDHPWVKDHPDWFKVLPDGSIKYAENPPKKYQDIYPVNFETEDWQALWQELKNVILTWADWGVKIIRVDNPHTKAFGFWEWVIAEVKAVHPDMIFLAEAFTKPKVMQQLAKLGYTQSYTYYTWRNSKTELIEYMNELTKGEMKHYFRPNFWPNTHDINPFNLQSGNEAMYLIRYFMAATLSSNYGVFGPTYEYIYHHGNPPKEEYFNSEKYEIKYWNWEHRNKLTYVMTEVNRIRKENSALQDTNNIEFCPVDNENLIAYIKTAANGNKILCVVNLDGSNRQSGSIKIPLWKIGKSEWENYRVHDLISGAQYTWKGENNFVELDPNILPFHLFRIEDMW
jgi:starch synthase (maltosyl-transferring)